MVARVTSPAATTAIRVSRLRTAVAHSCGVSAPCGDRTGSATLTPAVCVRPARFVTAVSFSPIRPAPTAAPPTATLTQHVADVANCQGTPPCDDPPVLLRCICRRADTKTTFMGGVSQPAGEVTLVFSGPLVANSGHITRQSNLTPPRVGCRDRTAGSISEAWVILSVRHPILLTNEQARTLEEPRRFPSGKPARGQAGRSFATPDPGLQANSHKRSSSRRRSSLPFTRLLGVRRSSRQSIAISTSADSLTQRASPVTWKTCSFQS